MVVVVAEEEAKEATPCTDCPANDEEVLKATATAGNKAKTARKTDFMIDNWFRFFREDSVMSSKCYYAEDLLRV